VRFLIRAVDAVAGPGTLAAAVDAAQAHAPDLRLLISETGPPAPPWRPPAA
jgi:hypothetical protein